MATLGTAEPGEVNYRLVSRWERKQFEETISIDEMFDETFHVVQYIRV